MIRLTEGLPGNTIVAEAVGTVTAEDYERVLTPALQHAAEGSEKLRLLYVLGAEFDGYDAGAATDDAKVGIRYWSAFERIGLVTDHETFRVLARAFGFLMPGEVRVFSLADRSAAEAWITGD